MNKKTKKRTLSMALAAALAFSPVQAFAASSDIAGHWAEDVITQWENAGKISGYEDGTFRPNNSVTRAEFVIMMNNALGLTEAGEVSFSDVQPGNWFYNAVAIAVAAGYCSGYEDGTFKPSATITRAEAAVMIANAAGLEQDATGAAGFTDSIPAWAQGSVGAVVNAGFMSGYPDGTFAANQSITRAEAVSSLNRVIGGVTANDVVVTEATEIADQTIDGNLIIDAALTDGKVTVKNTTVKGNIVVRGGAADALTLDGVTLNGKLIVEKEGAEVVLTGETKIPSVEISALSTLSEDNFKGSVGTITITKNLDTDKTVKLSVAADKLVLDGTAAVDVNKDIKTVEITKDAEGSKVYVNKGATVDTVIADAKANVSGSGTVKVLEANANGITVGSSLTVNKTEVAEGIEKPTTSTSGGGGGGGGSSSSSDDDDVVVTPTFVVDGTSGKTWADAVNAANKATSANYKILVKGSATGITVNDTITFTGKGTLTVQFEDGTNVTATSLTINAADAAKIELLDNGSEAKGVQLTTLTVNAPKATVNNNFAATTTNIQEVSNATFNVKDTATTINIAKGTVNITGAPTANVNVNGAGPVTVKGTAANVDVIAGGENAVVNIAGTVTGVINNSDKAATINVEDGANITNLATKACATYNVKGGKVGTLDLTTAPTGVTATGGTIDTLKLDANNLTVAGATVNNATVSIGTLTVDSGNVAKATVTGAATITGKGTVGTVTLDSGVTAVTIGSKVDMLEAKNSAKATVKFTQGATVGTLVANTAEVEIADTNGTIKDVVTTQKVTVQDKSQVTGSVTTGGTGQVVDKSGKPVDNVATTKITKVAKNESSNYKTEYYKGQELDLTGLVLDVTQTVTPAGGTAGKEETEPVAYADIATLVTISGYNKDSIGTQKVTLTYAGQTVDLGEFTVKLSQAQFEEEAKAALAGKVNSIFTEEDNTALTVADKWTNDTLPATLDLTSGGTAKVAWASGNAEYVKSDVYGANYKVEVLKAERDKKVPVTLTATVTSEDGAYTATATYTLKIKAVNQGAMDAWEKDIASKLTGTVTVKVDTTAIDVTNPAKVKEAITSYLSTENITASGYTLTVEKVEPSGDNWNATLKLASTSAATVDYVEKVVTFSLVDQTAGAKAELAKLAGLTSVALPSGTVAKGETEVTKVIKGIAQEKVAKEYTVEATNSKFTPAKDGKSATWEGTLTVTNSSVSEDTATSETITITATEGQDITFGTTAISGKTNEFSNADVTLKAGNTAFVGLQPGDDVTSWFVSPNGSLPAGLKAKVASLETNDTVLKVTIYRGTDEADKPLTIAATDGPIALTATVPAANLKDATSDLVADGGSSTTIDIKQGNEDIEVQGVAAAKGHTTLKITLKNGAEFEQTAGAEKTNYLWNNQAFEGTATVSPDQTSVSIKLSGKDLEALGSTGIKITIKAAAFGENVVKAEDVDTVVYMTPLADSNVIAANIQDTVTQPPISSLYTANNIDAADIDSDKLNVVQINTTDLKEHKNGPGTLGHWTGFAVTVPDGVDAITTVKYAFVNTEEELPETLSNSTDVEFVDVSGTKKGIAFYADITKDGVKVEHRYAAIQFCDAQGNAITPVYKFDMDFTGSNWAAQGVEVEASSKDYVIDSANAATGAGTITSGDSDKITTSTTVSEFKSYLSAVAPDSEDAEIKVVAAATAATITTAEEFDKATDKDATMENGDVVVVMSADRSVIGKYVVTVE